MSEDQSLEGWKQRAEKAERERDYYLEAGGELSKSLKLLREKLAVKEKGEKE